jgi:predicted Zn-dependent peptidase
MKLKNIATLALTLFSVLSFAQVDRSKLPEPATPRPIEIGKYESFELKNGLKVFIIENHKLPRVAYNLQFDRPPLLEGDKAGYLGMFGQMLRTGTETRTKEQLDQEIDFLGASVFGGSSNVFASGLSKYEEKILELMTDIAFNPTFPTEELEKIRKQTISGLAANKEDPNAIASNLNSKIVYGGDHPYGEIQTEETTNNITSDDFATYHDTYFRPNIGYLAVVGDVDVKKTKKLIKTYFSNWEAKAVTKPTYATPEMAAKNEVNIVNRSNSVQSVINISYPIVLPIGHPDVIGVRVMNTILGGGFSSKLNMNLREDKGYTYGARSNLGSDELVANFNASASVRNEVTDSSVVQMLFEMKQMIDGNITDEELELAKNSVAGSFSRSLESPQTVASFAVNSSIYKLPADYYATYVQKIQALTIDDIKALAKKYIKPENAYINIVGKGSDIADKLKPFGAIKYFDTYGNEVDPSLAKLPDGLTADKVIDSYLTAIGGKDKLRGVKNVTMKMNASVMGQSMEILTTKAAPNKMYMEMKMGGNVMQKIVFDGVKGKTSGMGGENVVEGEQAKEMALQAIIFDELMYKEIGAETKLSGVENINGKDAYGIEVTVSGNTTTRYYDAESGFLVRVSRTIEGPQGTMVMSQDYSDYKEFGGIMFPTGGKQPLNAQMKMDLSVSEVVVNGEVSADLFKQ